MSDHREANIETIVRVIEAALHRRFGSAEILECNKDTIDSELFNRIYIKLGDGITYGISVYIPAASDKRSEYGESPAETHGDCS